MVWPLALEFPICWILMPPWKLPLQDLAIWTVHPQPSPGSFSSAPLKAVLRPALAACPGRGMRGPASQASQITWNCWKSVAVKPGLAPGNVPVSGVRVCRWTSADQALTDTLFSKTTGKLLTLSLGRFSLPSHQSVLDISPRGSWYLGTLCSVTTLHARDPDVASLDVRADLLCFMGAFWSGLQPEFVNSAESSLAECALLTSKDTPP